MTFLDYTALFDAMQGSSLLLKADAPIYTILAATPQHLKDGGVTKEDIIGKSLFEAYPANRANLDETGEMNMRESFEYVLLNKKPHCLPVQRYDVADDNGEFIERYWRAENKPVFSSEGVVAFILQTTEELTAQIKAEESEKRFSNLLMESPFAFAILKGQDMVVALANEAIKRIWGKGTELEGMPLLSLMPEVREQGFGALLDKVYTTGKPFYGHEELVKLQRNGIWEDVYFNFIYQPYKESDDTISGVTIIANEVTSQAIANKRIAASEENVRRLFMQAPAVICVLRGPQHVIELANNHYYQLVGKKDLLGKPVREALPELEGQGFFELLDNVYATGEPFIGNELPARFDRGAGRLEDAFVNFVYQASHNSDEQIEGILVHAVDVTEQVLAKKKLEEEEKLQAFLLKFSDSLRTETNVDGLASRALQMLSDNLMLDRCYIGVYNRADDWGEFPYQVGNNRVPPMPDSVRLSDFPDALCIAIDQTLVIDDMANAEGLTDTDRKNFGALGMYALVAATLRSGESSPLWSIVAVSSCPRRWTVSEVKLIEEVTERTWAAVEKGKTEEKLRKAEEQYLNKLEGEVQQRTAELKENTELLQTVFDASPNSISVFEILYNEHSEVYDFKILIFNAVTIENIGGKNVIGQKYSKAFPHAVESGVLDEFITVAHTGKQKEFEKWYKGDGMHHCFRFIVNKTGKLLLVTTEDVTERKVSEERLRTNFTLLQQSEDLGKMGSWEYDIATGDFTWSNGMYELFGLPKGVNIRPEVYRDHAVDEERHIAERIFERFKKPQAFEETLCIKRADSVRELKIKASIISDEKGGSRKLVGVDLDITEAKLSEKTLRDQAHFIKSTNDALPDILFVMNLHSKATIYINHSFEETLGYPEVSESGPEKNIIALIYEEDVPVMLSHLEDLKNSADGEVFEIQYRLKAADGSFRWFSDRNTVFKRDRDGIPMEKIGIAQDITVRKKAEQELKESNTNLLYANENLQQFASIASHDLQEPLRKLNLFASVLQRYDSELPEEAKAVIQKISLTSVRMRQLITEVLQYSKIAYGKKVFETTDLHHILQNVLRDLDMMIVDTETNIQYDESLPEIEAVPLQMNQLFYNLLTNAIKFSKDGLTPKVHVSYRILPHQELNNYKELDTAKRHIEIQFSDNGVGFDQHYAGQIFDLFERLYSTDEYEGTGVGLALCKKIVENHHGHIYAKSKYGEGAKFYILLPVTQRTGANLLKPKNEV